ncbi:MAG: tRNA (adenosine(37)-N6)-dimethylallyltransferase MiaA [Akkermansia sp.]|nr:tRNA (adenosine(37)-N6)-dimethylallyltransferase MiaA [Akkermansia sp.]
MGPLFILGPTGCGKSAVAVEVARQLGNAEIVSADAYQVYRALPVLTAAPTAQEMQGVPHHLIGTLDVRENNDAATHARRAQACIASIIARGALPIVTGGSGLYVKFISHGISPAPPSDPALRAELEALPPEEAVRRLQKADPEGAAATNLQNPRYVVRNLEIVLLGGKPLSYWRNNWQPQACGPGFCLTRDVSELDTRIARRAERMLADGAIDEVASLPDQLSSTAEKTLGLSLIREHLAGNMNLRELASALALATRQYAKRQRTWLRREPWARPIPCSGCAAEQILASDALKLLFGHL